MLAKQGEKGLAVEQLNNEINVYPESKTFIERISIMLGLED
jgi:hypothetical protein